MMGTSILQVNDLRKRFGGLTAVDGVAFTVEEGEIFGIVGPNGAGKTVLLNCVSGLLRPDSGSVITLGRDTTFWPPERKCTLGVSRTFQIPRPFPRLTLLENVMVAAEFGRRDSAAGQARSVAERWLEFVGLDHASSLPAAQLNALDLKRLDLARALGSEPKLLLLDEVGAGLMTGEVPRLVALIRHINELGITIVMVEHVVKTITELCHRVLVLDYGRSVIEGPPKAVIEEPAVIEAYLGKHYRPATGAPS